MHRLLGNEHFDALWGEKGAFIQRMLEIARTGGDFQGCYSTVMRDALDRGSIALILEKGDETTRSEFEKAVEYAFTLVTGSGPSKAFRSYDVQVNVSERGARVAAIQEKVERFKGGRPLTAAHYYLALATIIAFGTEDERRIAAEYPEERYRNPNVIVHEALFTELRAVKAWLLGEESRAKKDALAALKECREETSRPEIAALLALMTGDAAGFREHLEERVKAYKKQYQKSPNLPEGVVYMFGVALCRLARERGIVAEDGPYLPLHLLPNVTTG